MTTHDPEVSERDRQAAPVVEFTALGEPGECRAQVVVLAGDAVDPGPRLVSEPQMRLGRFGPGEVLAGVRLPDGVAFATTVELLHGEFADRLQHPEVGLTLQ